MPDDYHDVIEWFNGLTFAQREQLREGWLAAARRASWFFQIPEAEDMAVREVIEYTPSGTASRVRFFQVCDDCGTEVEATPTDAASAVHPRGWLVVNRLGAGQTCSRLLSYCPACATGHPREGEVRP